jgi:hypothetical protein
MSTSTLILHPGTQGDAQITPTRFPTTINVSFSLQEQAEVFYGIDGRKPTTPLKPGETQISINVNSLQLAYRVASGQAKIQWEL